MEANQQPASNWSLRGVLIFSCICFALGMAIGALVRGPAHAAASASLAMPSAPAPDKDHMVQQHIAMQQQMAAEAEAAEKNAKETKSPAALAKAGDLNLRQGSFKPAIEFYGESLKLKEDPKVRVNLGNAYFKSGDADGALKQYSVVLKADPKNDQALFNSGVVYLQAKKDSKSALKCWRSILEYYPNHPRRAAVEQLIAKASAAQLPQEIQ
jgi:tetratricopeptide (TPR) repeat protein